MLQTKIRLCSLCWSYICTGYVFLIFFLKVAAHLAFFDLAVDKFFGTDPVQDAESLIQLIERNINFAFGDAPGDAGELAKYTFRKKALFSFLLRRLAAEWYENTITNATTWENVQTNFINSFSDGGNKFRYRMEVEHCTRRDGEKIEIFYTGSNERLIKAGPMTWTVLRPLNTMQIVMLKNDKEVRDISTTR